MKKLPDGVEFADSKSTPSSAMPSSMVSYSVSANVGLPLHMMS